MDRQERFNRLTELTSLVYEAENLVETTNEKALKAIISIGTALIEMKNREFSGVSREEMKEFWNRYPEWRSNRNC